MMKFLDRPPRFLFFTGKGGVGKTTLAAAIAVELAHRGLALLRQRAACELREITAVARQHAQRYAVVPLLRNEPVGVARLLELAAGSPAAAEAA